MLTDELFYMTKNYHEKFFELCNPIKKYLGITTAAYLNVNQNGEMEMIASNHKWIERFIEESYFNQDPGMVHPKNMNSGFSFVTTSDDQEYKSTMLHEAIHKFDFHHGFCYVEKNGSSFSLFYFATQKENNNIINKITNEANLVKKFIRNLNKQIISEFKDFQDNKVDLIKLKSDLFFGKKGIVFNDDQENHQKMEILKEEGFIHNSYSDSDLIKLSKQEINCLRIYMEDCSIKNIAKSLNIALTTATSYIENIKQKLNCYTKQDLLKVATVLTGLGKI